MLGVNCEGEIIDQISYLEQVEVVKKGPEPEIKEKTVLLFAFENLEKSKWIDEMKIEDITFVFHRFEKYTEDFVKESLDLWNIHRPSLVLQLGKHEKEANLVEFEKFGCDYDEKHIFADSRLDFDKIIKQLNEKNDELKYVKTEKTHFDLCSFSHFLAMNKSQEKSLAIYVQTLNDEKIVEALSDAVKIVLNK